LAERKMRQRNWCAGVALLGTLAGFQAFGADAPLQLSTGNEDAIGSGIAPPGLAPPSSDPRSFEGSWYPFRPPQPAGAKQAGPPPKSNPSSIFTNDENAPNSFELCGAVPIFLGTMGVGIVQSKDTVVVANEESGDYRVIEINGEHSKQLVPTRKGHSVAHWEGNVLVVDVTGFKLQNGTPSDAHVTERIYKAEHNTRLNDDLAVVYPSTGLKETRSSAYRWRPDLRVSEEVCEEGYSDFQLKNGKLQITPAGQ